MNKILKLFLGVLLASIFTWLFLKNIDYQSFKNTLKDINYNIICLSLLSFSLGYIIRVSRWKLVLQQYQTNITWKQCFTPFVGSIAINNILPFRAGDAMRAVAFNKDLNISLSMAISSLFLERILDMLTLLIYFGVALILLNISSSLFFGYAGSSFLLLGFILCIILNFPRVFKVPTLKLIQIFLGRSNNFQKKIYSFTEELFNNFEISVKKKILFKLVIMSLCIWFFEGLVFYLVALAISDLEYPRAAFLSMPIGTLSTLIPSTPGYVGTFDYFTSQAMIVLDNNENATKVFALLVHLVLWLPITIIGSLSLFIYKFYYPLKVNS